MAPRRKLVEDGDFYMTYNGRRIADIGRWQQKSLHEKPCASDDAGR
jgi:hypothetical protein